MLLVPERKTAPGWAPTPHLDDEVADFIWVGWPRTVHGCGGEGWCHIIAENHLRTGLQTPVELGDVIVLPEREEDMGWRRALPLPPFTLHPTSVPLGCFGSSEGLRRQCQRSLKALDPTFPPLRLSTGSRLDWLGPETRAVDKAPSQKTDASGQGLVDATNMVSWLTQPSLPGVMGAPPPDPRTAPQCPTWSSSPPPSSP